MKPLLNLLMLAMPLFGMAQNISQKTIDSLAQVGITVDYLTGRYTPNKDARFVQMSNQHSNAVRFVRKEANEAFKKMYAAAQKEGIKLTVISAFRSFYDQRSIWDAKFEGKRQVDGKMLDPKLSDEEKVKRILRWSAMPGTSRHHWGTDIDINSVSPAYWNTPKGKKEYAWLIKNAPSYGFCQVYSAFSDNGRKSGYQEEKWHWSYLPVANNLTHWYTKLIKNQDLKDCKGATVATKIDIIKNYVLGLNPNCK